MGTVAKKRAEPAAHRATRRRLSAVVPVEEATRTLAKHLGRKLLAITLDVAPTTVDRYLRGDQPRLDTEKRIQDAYGIWQMVSAVESAATTRAWWMGMKDQLDDLSPAEAIAQGQARDVKAVARDFVESG